MVLPVPGEEGDTAALHEADDDVATRLPEGRPDGHPLGVVEEPVEPGAADDAVVGGGEGSGHPRRLAAT